jgi:hypothetical protein
LRGERLSKSKLLFCNKKSDVLKAQVCCVTVT